MSPAQRSGTSELVVTISASYGAGGSVIAPLLAERLGVVWLDRLVSADAATGTAGGNPSLGDAAASGIVPGGTASVSTEALSEGEAASTPGSRLFTYLARAIGVNGMVPPDSLIDRDEELRVSAEEGIAALCASGGVLLGRAGAVVLAGRPATVHIRLDGPEDRRVRRAAEIEGITIAESQQRLVDTDRARNLYVKRLYRTDPTSSRLYHLVLDTTRLGTGEAVGLLAAAVDAFRD